MLGFVHLSTSKVKTSQGLDLMTMAVWVHHAICALTAQHAAVWGMARLAQLQADCAPPNQPGGGCVHVY